MSDHDALESLMRSAAVAALLSLLLYLFRINQLLRRTPDEVKKLSGPRWTRDELKKTYERLKETPILYDDKLPPKLDRRYVVTGGSGKCRILCGLVSMPSSGMDPGN